MYPASSSIVKIAPAPLPPPLAVQPLDEPEPESVGVTLSAVSTPEMASLPPVVSVEPASGSAFLAYGLIAAW